MKKISTELEKVVYDEPTFADAVDTLINDIIRQSTNAIKIYVNGLKMKSRMILRHSIHFQM